MIKLGEFMDCKYGLYEEAICYLRVLKEYDPKSETRYMELFAKITPNPLENKEDDYWSTVNASELVGNMLAVVQKLSPPYVYFGCQSVKTWSKLGFWPDMILLETDQQNGRIANYSQYDKTKQKGIFYIQEDDKTLILFDAEGNEVWRFPKELLDDNGKDN